jgi:hypothetical protein
MGFGGKTDAVLAVGLASSLAVNVAFWLSSPRLPQAWLETGPSVGSSNAPASGETANAGASDRRPSAAAAQCLSETSMLEGRLRQLEQELLGVALPEEVFALLGRNPRLTSQIDGVVKRAVAPSKAAGVIRDVECRGSICRISLDSLLGGQGTEHEDAVARLRGSEEIRSSLVQGFGWGPIEYRRDPETGRDHRIVPLYLALKREN